MKNIKTIGLIVSLFLTLFLVSCEEDIHMIDIFEVSATDIELNYEGLLESGNSATFEIGTTKAWKVVSLPEWVTLTRNSGEKGRQTIVLKVEAIGPDSDRDGAIVIESQGKTHTIVVTQVKKTEQLVVSPATLQVNIHGALVSGDGEPAIYISTNSDWAISGLPAWVKVEKNSGEPGDIPVVLTVEMNKTGQLREGSFSVEAGALSETVTIKQDISYDAVTDVTEVIGNQRGEIINENGSFEVVSPVAWTATADAWIHINPASGEAGTTTVTVSMDAAREPRNGTITFTDADGLTTVVAVKQEVVLGDDGKAVGYVYLTDDFEWVRPYGGEDELEKISPNYPGKGTGGSTKPIHNTAGALDDFTGRGYEVFNPTGQAFYLGAHYFKMGKTDQQVGLIIPSIPGIAENKSTNMTFTFDVTPSRAASGDYDDVILHVLIEGPGSVGLNDGVTKSKDISIQIPNDNTKDWPWLERSVELYGISSETRVTIKPSPNTPNVRFARWLLNDIEFKKHSKVE